MNEATETYLVRYYGPDGDLHVHQAEALHGEAAVQVARQEARPPIAHLKSVSRVGAPEGSIYDFLFPDAREGSDARH